MELDRALAQVAAIQDQLTRTEVYRGYRALPIAASGLIGLAAAWMQPPALAGDPSAFVRYWIIVAACAGAVSISEIVYNYVAVDEELARTRTRRVVGQMLPSVAGAAIFTACLIRVSPALVALLPGLWAICFGIGIFASRSFLPPATGWIALYFYAAGVWLSWTAQGPAAPSPWTVGGTFGAGQLFSAAVLYWNLELPSAARSFEHQESQE